MNSEAYRELIRGAPGRLATSTHLPSMRTTILPTGTPPCSPSTRNPKSEPDITLGSENGRISNTWALATEETANKDITQSNFKRRKCRVPHPRSASRVQAVFELH